MIVLLGILLASIAGAGPPGGSHHEISNHLLLWTDVDAHTRHDTIGREIVLHPDRRAKIVQRDEDASRWTHDSPEATSFKLLGLDIDIEFSVSDTHVLSVMGDDSLGSIEEQITHLWRLSDEEVAAITDRGELLYFQLVRTSYYTSRLQFGRFDLDPMMGDLSSLDLRMNHEALSYSDRFPVPKLFLLTSDDADPSYVHCVVWQNWQRTELQLYSARIRFSDHEAPWPGESKDRSRGERDGVMSQVPPIYLDLPRVSASRSSNFNVWAILGGGGQMTSVDAVNDVAATPTFALGLRFKRVQYEHDSSATQQTGALHYVINGTDKQHRYGLRWGEWLGHRALTVDVGTEVKNKIHFGYNWYLGGGQAFTVGGDIWVGPRVAALEPLVLVPSLFTNGFFLLSNLSDTDSMSAFAIGVRLRAQNL